MKNPILVIFGGSDHEEIAARKVCEKANVWTATATVNGNKCHAGNAYQADGCSLDGPYYGNDDAPVCAVIVFECTPGACPANGVLTNRCDHHNEGDFGFGLGAADFWEASSIGQLCALLGVPSTEELLLVAAGDHCPADAYQGRCPGIDKELFLAFRISQKVTVTCIESMPSPTDGQTMPAYHDDRKQIEKAISFATLLLTLAPDSHIEGVKDLRQYGMVDQLPEAALILGLAYLSQVPDTNRDGMPTGLVKIGLGGDNTPETVTKVMSWLNAEHGGIAPAYGAPARGYAGRVFSPLQMASRFN